MTFTHAIGVVLGAMFAAPRPEPAPGAQPTRLICRCGEPWMECAHVAYLVLPGGHEFELTGRRAGGVS